MPFVRCTIKTYRRLCGGLKINDLVRCHPPRLDFIVGFCNASFIYHQKCLQHEMLHSFTLHKTMLSYKKITKILLHLKREQFFLLLLQQTRNTDTQHNRVQWNFSISCGLHGSHFWSLMIRIFFISSSLLSAQQWQFSAIWHRRTTAIVPATSLGIVEFTIYAASVLSERWVWLEYWNQSLKFDKGNLIFSSIFNFPLKSEFSF